MNRILKLLQLRLFILLHQILVLQRNITGSARSSQISIETFIFGGQSPLLMLNLHQPQMCSIKLRSQQGVSLF
jgi:hypothetical protein